MGIDYVLGKQKKARDWFIKRIMILVGVVGFFLAILFFDELADADSIDVFMAAESAGVMAVIASFMLFLPRWGSKTAYESAYKEYFAERTLEKVFPGCTFNSSAGIQSGALKATEMINVGDRFTSEDLVLGTYNGVSFVRSDVKVEKLNILTSSDNRDDYTTIFQGEWYIFELNKKFLYKLQVTGKNFDNRIHPVDKSGRKFEKIEFESSTFMKKFKVRGQDGAEAFYLFDPAFLERVEALGDKYNGKIQICFFENKMYLGLDSGIDMFKAPGVFSKIDEEKEIAKTAEHVKMITDIVDIVRK